MHKFGQPEIQHTNAGDGGAQKAATAEVDGGSTWGFSLCGGWGRGLVNELDQRLTGLHDIVASSDALPLPTFLAECATPAG